MSKNYVSRSTEESREKHIISRLAIIESLFFVALAWFIAYYYDFYIHIYVALGIAFFSFLKTPESTKEALDFFFFYNHDRMYYYNRDKSILITIFTIFSLIALHYLNIKAVVFFNSMPLYIQSLFFLFAISLILIKEANSNKNIGAFIQRFLGPIILIIDSIQFVFKQIAHLLEGLVYIIPIKILRYFVLIPFLPFILLLEGISALIILFKVIIIKVVYTLYFIIKEPIKSFSNIATNSRELLFVNDIFYSPELIKGIQKYQKEHYQLSAIIKDLKNTHFLELFREIILALILFLSYGYYFIVKSTAWLFFPLAYTSTTTRKPTK
jgi:hypothetical protein